MKRDEAYYISLYKDYTEKHLPEVETLAGLWAPDFDETAYPNLDFVSALQAYLNDLEPYCKVLSKAAELRQDHYRLFIENKINEDSGHRNWREGMNFMADDCQEKLKYWKEIHSKALNELIEEDEIEKAKESSKKLNIDISIRNYDLEERKTQKDKTKRFNPKHIVKRPPLSAKEKKRRLRQHQAWVKARRALEDKMLDEVIGTNEEELLEYDVYNNPNARNVDADEFIEMCQKIGLDNFAVNKFNGIKHSEIIKIIKSINFDLDLHSNDYFREIRKIVEYFLRIVYSLDINNDLNARRKNNSFNVLYTRFTLYLIQIISDIDNIHFGVMLATVLDLFENNEEFKQLNVTTFDANTALWEFIAAICVFTDPSDITELDKVHRESDLLTYIITVYLNAFYTVYVKLIFNARTVLDKKGARLLYNNPNFHGFHEPNFNRKLLTKYSQFVEFKEEWRREVATFKKKFDIS